MPDVTITITAPGTTPSYFMALDQNAQPAIGVTYFCRMVRMSNYGLFVGSAFVRSGYGASEMTMSAVSDDSGVVQFAGTIGGCIYVVWREGSRRKTKIMVSNALPTYAIPNFTG